MSACKPARSADWHSQACGTSHWSLSRASSLLMPRHAPPHANTCIIHTLHHSQIQHAQPSPAAAPHAAARTARSSTAAASAKAKALDASRGRARQLTTRAGGSSVASFASQHAQPLPAAASHAAAKTARSSTAAATAKAKALNASAGRARQLICELVAAA